MAALGADETGVVDVVVAVPEDMGALVDVVVVAEEETFGVDVVSDTAWLSG